VVTYSTHAEQKLSTRGIAREDVERIIVRPSETYEDTENNATVVTGSLGSRTLVVIYRRTEGDVRVITVYHTQKTEKLLTSKVRRGAWRKTR
jgi:uncharacterized DUF497 family protein